MKDIKKNPVASPLDELRRLVRFLEQVQSKGQVISPIERDIALSTLRSIYISVLDVTADMGGDTRISVDSTVITVEGAMSEVVSDSTDVLESGELSVEDISAGASPEAGRIPEADELSVAGVRVTVAPQAEIMAEADSDAAQEKMSDFEGFSMDVVPESCDDENLSDADSLEHAPSLGEEDREDDPFGEQALSLLVTLSDSSRVLSDSSQVSNDSVQVPIDSAAMPDSEFMVDIEPKDTDSSETRSVSDFSSEPGVHFDQAVSIESSEVVQGYSREAVEDSSEGSGNISEELCSQESLTESTAQKSDREMMEDSTQGEVLAEELESAALDSSESSQVNVILKEQLLYPEGDSQSVTMVAGQHDLASESDCDYSGVEVGSKAVHESDVSIISSGEDFDDSNIGSEGVVAVAEPVDISSSTDNVDLNEEEEFIESLEAAVETESADSEETDGVTVSGEADAAVLKEMDDSAVSEGVIESIDSGSSNAFLDSVEISDSMIVSACGNDVEDSVTEPEVAVLSEESIANEPLVDMVELFGQKISSDLRAIFVKELFWRDEHFFCSEIAKMERMHSLDQLLIYVGDQYSWKADSRTAEQFIELFADGLSK